MTEEQLKALDTRIKQIEVKLVTLEGQWSKDGDPESRKKMQALQDTLEDLKAKLAEQRKPAAPPPPPPPPPAPEERTFAQEIGLED